MVFILVSKYDFLLLLDSLVIYSLFLTFYFSRVTCVVKYAPA